MHTHQSGDLALRWHHDPRWRLGIAIFVGIAAIVISTEVMHFSWLHAVLIGWSAIGFFYCLITTFAIWRMDPKQTATHARAEDFGRLSDRATHITLIMASGASLFGLIALLIQNETTMVAPALLTFIVVAVSWTTIQITYTLRYARLFYEANNGIDFSQDPDPQYSDFAYLAFTMGMAFQVSDTQFTNSKIRRIALGHAILTYVFGTIILASVVNIVTSLSAS